MPELPEVETIVNGVKPYLINKKIIKCNVFTKKLRWNLQNDLAKKLINKKINKIERRAKYIIISGENFFLTIHLGMTGTLRISNKKEKKGIEDLCDNPARLINGHDIIKGNPQKEKKDQKPISPCFDWEYQDKKRKEKKVIISLYCPIMLFYAPIYCKQTQA